LAGDATGCDVRAHDTPSWRSAPPASAPADASGVAEAIVGPKDAAETKAIAAGMRRFG
jgi:hypothetical protein